MSAYQHGSNHHKRVRRLRRVRRAAQINLLALTLLLVGGGVYAWQQLSHQQETPSSKQVSLGYYTGNPKKVYGNELFQFESTLDWQFSQEASRLPVRYTYYSLKNGLVHYELNIVLQRAPEDLSVNYILPVRVQNGVLQPLTMSSHCGQGLPRSSQLVVRREYEGVKFNCEAQGSRRVYGAGVIGGSYDIPLYNSKGRLVNAHFILTDHSSAQQPDIFPDILKSFKLK